MIKRRGVILIFLLFIIASMIIAVRMSLNNDMPSIEIGTGEVVETTLEVTKENTLEPIVPPGFGNVIQTIKLKLNWSGKGADGALGNLTISSDIEDKAGMLDKDSLNYMFNFRNNHHRSTKFSNRNIHRVYQ